MMPAVTLPHLLSCRLLQEEEEEIHNSDGDAAHCICAHPHLWPSSDDQDAEHHGWRLLPRSHCECTFAGLFPVRVHKKRGVSEVNVCSKLFPLLDSEENNY